jgi:hypothetical protein
MSETQTRKRSTIVDGVTTCECGSTEFKYEESHPSERTMATNEGGVLMFWSDFEWFDGDSDPGVTCCGCGSAVDVGEYGFGG